MSSQLAALVLAAGGSRRLGQAKQRIRYQGESLLRRSARLARDAIAGRVFVVLGAEASSLRAELAGLEVTPLYNHCWEQGLGTSIASGMAALGDARGVLLLLADQWALTATDLAALTAHFHSEPDCIVASRFQACCGAPAVFPRALFPALARLSGDRGARTLLRRHRDRVRPVCLPRAGFDLDTSEDLARLRHQESPGEAVL